MLTQHHIEKSIMQACLENLCRMVPGNVTDLTQLVGGWAEFDQHCPLDENLMTWIDHVVIGIQELAQHTKETANIASDEVYSSLISIQQTRSLATLLEIVWTVRLNKFVVSRTHISAISASAKSTILVNERVMLELQSYSIESNRISVLNINQAIDEIIFHPSFSSLLFNRFHGRIILTYLAIEHDGSVPGMDKQLHRVIFSNSTVKALAVTQLSRMMKSVEWLKDRSSQLISEVLLSEGGLQAVLQGYLEGLLESPHLTSVQILLAKSLATIPSSHTTTKESYFKNLFHQVIILWQAAGGEGSGTGGRDKILQQSLVLIIIRCLQCHPQLTEELCLKVMFAPLLKLFAPPKNEGMKNTISETASVILIPSHILATRTEIGFTLQSLILFLSMIPSLSMSFIGWSLYKIHIVTAILMLYTENNGSSNISQISEKSSSSLSDKVKGWLVNGILKPLFSLFLHGCGSSDGKGKEGGVSLLDILFDFACDNDSGGMVEGRFVVYDDHSIDIHSTPSTTTTHANRITSIVNLLSILTKLDLNHSNNHSSSSSSNKKKSAKAINFSTFTSQFFVKVLTTFFSFQTTANSNNNKQQQQLMLVSIMLTEMVEKLSMDCLLSRDVEVLMVLMTILQHSLTTTVATTSESEHDLKEGKGKKQSLIVEIDDTDSHTDNANEGGDGSSSAVSDLSLTHIALNILSTLLQQQSPLPPHHNTSLSELQSILHSLSYASQLTLTENQLAADCALTLLHRRLYPVDENEKKSNDNTGTDYIDSVNQEYLLSESPPIRAYGLKLLSNLIQSTTTAQLLSISQLTQILSYMLFIGLQDIDTYVNIQATLCVLTLLRCSKYHFCHSKILATLIHHFASFSPRMFHSVFADFQVTIFDLKNPKSETAKHDIRLSLRIGEVISQIMKRRSAIMSFDTTVNSTLLVGLVAMCLRITRYSNSNNNSPYDQNNIHDKFTGRLLPSSTQLDSSPPLMEDFQRSVEQIDQLYLRQSAISLLAEMVPILGYKITHFIVDIFDIAMSICLLENSYVDTNNRVMRRAAIFLLRYILEQFPQLLLDDHPELLSELGSGLGIMEGKEKDEVVCFQMEKIKMIVDTLLSQRLLHGLSLS